MLPVIIQWRRYFLILYKSVKQASLVQIFIFQIMKRVLSLDEERQPKILGLSATLLNANVNNNLEIKLKDLESIFDAKIVTSERCREIRERFSVALFSLSIPRN